jgi:hypothetical protein
MAVAIGWDQKVTASSVLTMRTGSAAAGLPLSNLLTEQPSIRARLVGTTVAFSVDLLSAVGLDWVALLSTTIPAGASVQLDGSTSDATGAAADSGTVTVTAAGTAASRYAVHLRATGWTARYLRVTVSGLATGCDIGVLHAGPLLTLTYGIQALTEGRLVLDQRDRNPVSGAEFLLPGTSPRYIAGALPVLTRTEIAGGMRSLAALGAADVLFIPATADSQAELSARVLRGAINDPGARVGIQRAGIYGGRQFQVVDRL